MTAAEKPTLACHQLRVVRGGRALLEGVDLALPPGQLMAVVGKNGAGKSTLLKALCGDLSIDGGQVHLDGESVAAQHPAALARRRAVLAQETHLAFDFPVRQVVGLGRLAHADSDPARHAAAVDACLALTDTAHLADRTITALSGGERARVHLARVLAQIDAHESDRHGPRYLLLDEPAASLDWAHQIDLFGLLRRLVRPGRIGVLVTVHDLNLAARYTDRVLMLRDGRALVDAEPARALSVDLLGRGFDIDACILAHPGGGPLIVAMGRVSAPDANHPKETHDAVEQ